MTDSTALRVMIVEDQFLIAKQLEFIVMSGGHTVVGTVDSRDAACDLALATSPDIAFVDLSLADGVTGLEVASVIGETAGTQVVFTTANARRLPADFCGAIGLIEKPFSRAGLLAALKYISTQVRNHAAVGPPNSLLLSPDYAARWTQPAAQS